MTETARPGVVALVGPTGSGKSAVAAEVADPDAVEVVAVDAFTVYRGMDVGTAKPSVAERAHLAHHMVDVLLPHQECTVAWFQHQARAAVAAVHGRGRVPLLVGGSGLYFRAVVDPLRFPPTDPTVRSRLERRYRDNPARAHAELAARDPEAAARIDSENLRRSVRALEVLELTAEPFSRWRTAWDRFDSVFGDLDVIGVDVDPTALRGRIDERAEAMVGGLLDEARRLALRPPGLSATARQAIGYAEALQCLGGRASRADTAAAIAARTRRYAARQRRWFAQDPRVRWEAPTAVADALAKALAGALDRSGR